MSTMASCGAVYCTADADIGPHTHDGKGRITRTRTRTVFEEATHPFGPQVYRDYEDFIERVARPMVESEGLSSDEREAALQDALDGFRTVSPYYLCTSLVMMTNRIQRAEAEATELRATIQPVVDAWRQEGSHPHHHRAVKQGTIERWPSLTAALAKLSLLWERT